jgi:hypothetical protein
MGLVCGCTGNERNDHRDLKYDSLPTNVTTLRGSLASNHNSHFSFEPIGSNRSRTSQRSTISLNIVEGGDRTTKKETWDSIKLVKLRPEEMHAGNPEYRR